MALDRLLNQLNNTGLQQKDMPLYQVIARLIKELQQVIIDTSNIGGGDGGGGGVPVINNITNVTQFLDLMSDSGGGSEGEIGPPGPAGANGTSTGGMVPYFIASDEIFTVPEFSQALFAMNIDNEGILDVEGFLIEVD